MVVGVTLLSLWLFFVTHDPAPAPISTPSFAICAQDGPAISIGEIALFQEIVRARQTALTEAQTFAPSPDDGRPPGAPSTGLDKGVAKRSGIASVRTAEYLEGIARAHGMTQEEIEDIYRRGEAEGWPAVPQKSSFDRPCDAVPSER